jgi:ribosomal protein S18 acetylase RimI-like enzyme
MGTAVTVREATTDDAGAIRRVARAAWHETYDFIDEETVEGMLAQGYSEEFLAAAIERPELTLFVAERGVEIVGYASCEPPGENGVGEVSVYVHPDCWREGLGTALLDRAEAYLRAQDAETVEDAVLADNEVGNAFYRGRFDDAGTRTVQLGDEEFEATVYRREL